MRYRHPFVHVFVVAVVGLLLTTCGTRSQPWGAEAERWIDSWFLARHEGVANELMFYDPNVLWEDRTGGHLFTGRDDFVSYATSLLGDVDPTEPVAVFVSADEALVWSWWPTWTPPVDMLARLRIGTSGIEHVVNTSSTASGRTYAPGVVDFDAIDALVRRWVAFWNGADIAPTALYEPAAMVTDTLLGASTIGIDRIGEARTVGAWPDLAPTTIEPLADGTGEAITIGPALRPSDLDEIGFVVRVDDHACPRLMSVVVGWDGDRIVWERRFHELLAARACEPVQSFAAGWWEGLVAPAPIARVFTGVVREPSSGLSVSVYNGSPELEKVIGHLVQHFVDAGIGVPRMREFAFVEYRSKCTALDGFTTSGPHGEVVNICLEQREICEDPACERIDHHAELMMLHELAHVWLFENADEELRRDFMEFVGLSNWDDPDADWADRAIERAASAIAVGVAGDLGPQGCDDGRYCDVRPGSFELLTGRPPVSAPAP